MGPILNYTNCLMTLMVMMVRLYLRTDSIEIRVLYNLV